jgi:hypothetical protein
VKRIQDNEITVDLFSIPGTIASMPDGTFSGSPALLMMRGQGCLTDLSGRLGFTATSEPKRPGGSFRTQSQSGPRPQ